MAYVANPLAGAPSDGPRSSSQLTREPGCGPVSRFAPVMGAIAEGRELVLTAIDYPPFSYVKTIGKSAEHLPVGDRKPHHAEGPNGPREGINGVATRTQDS